MAFSIVTDDDGASLKSRHYSGGGEFLAAGESLDRALPIAFVGTYGPRRCGIATFTADLAALSPGRPARVAHGAGRHRAGGQYQYPPRSSSRFGRTSRPTTRAPRSS